MIEQWLTVAFGLWAVLFAVLWWIRAKKPVDDEVYEEESDDISEPVGFRISGGEGGEAVIFGELVGFGEHEARGAVMVGGDLYLLLESTMMLHKIKVESSLPEKPKAAKIQSIKKGA